MDQALEVGPDRHDDGPVELDGPTLSLIGGGLPRGGWLGMESLPPASAEQALPRGGWTF